MRRRYIKGHYFRELTDEVIDTMVAVTGRRPVRARSRAAGVRRRDRCDVRGRHRVQPPRTAVELGASTGWTDPGEDEVRIETARAYAATLEPFATGVYVNVLGDEGAAGVRRAYPPTSSPGSPP